MMKFLSKPGVRMQDKYWTVYCALRQLKQVGKDAQEELLDRDITRAFDGKYNVWSPPRLGGCGYFTLPTFVRRKILSILKQYALANS